MSTSCCLLPWYYNCDYCTIVTSEQHLYQTIVQFDKTIVLPRKLATGSIHDYLFWYCPLVGILFEVLIILSTSNRIPTRGQQQQMQSCLLLVDSCHGITIVISDCTIVTSGHHGSIRTTFISNNTTTQKTCNRKYT